MSIQDDRQDVVMMRAIVDQLSNNDLQSLSHSVQSLEHSQVRSVLERLGAKQRAVVYRMLPKEQALEVFESLTPGLRGDLVQSLQDAEVAAIFADLDPDDRVWLLDELPATVAPQLLRGLSAKERQRTSGVLGYPQNSVGRRMSAEYITTRSDMTAGETLAKVRKYIAETETVYTLPVLDDARILVGVVHLRNLLAVDDETMIADIMAALPRVLATDDAERAARLALEIGALALPIVDNEDRFVGMLTIDDAARILEREESEDAARQGGYEPLHRPYLSTSIFSLVRSRVVWLLVLALGATLTVQVLEVFEATLEQLTVLALFVPLLIGTGGNTGNQAATTVTRALALQDVRPRDVWLVLFRELRVGFCLGLLLGALGFAAAGLIYSMPIGAVIGLTLLAVCTMAATVGGIMPIIAKAVRVDPAVFSNPFITTFVDATGLVVYFLIARALLGL
ncbi:magnesium transporter [Humidisolicoccus flavus]|uniref:magnesium transporter n=1 Tax=Humidisolicoccus flavus TaxID=3111414 RepID=UPI003244FBD8